MTVNVNEIPKWVKDMNIKNNQDHILFRMNNNDKSMQ